MKATNNNNNSVNIYELVTERIIEQMQNGLIPWRRPWNVAKMTGKDTAINYVTRHAYSPLNQMLLGEAGEYLTFKQVTELKGKVKAGAHSRLVVFYKPQVCTREKTTTDENGNEKTVKEQFTIPYLQYYRVFHLNDTEGIPSKITATEEVKPEPEQIIQTAEDVVLNYVTREGIKFINNKPSNSAYYQPSTDTVVLPQKKQFKTIGAYYGTAFHELTHSTLTKNRCDRTENGNATAAFGSQVYSREELVAEIGSAMLCTATGIDNTDIFENSIAYLQSWIKALKNDSKMIVWAAGRAEKAAKYIQGIKDTENN